MGWRPCRSAEVRRGIDTAALLVALFGLCALATRFLLSDDSGYSSFWSANAAMLVALLTLRPALAAAVLAACLCTNLLINQLSALSPPESVLACILNVLQAVLAAPFTRRFCGAVTNLMRPRRFAAFTVIALLSAAAEAALGVAVERIFLNDPGVPLHEWVQWVLCDALGLLLATPAVLHLVRASPRRPATRPHVDTGALTLLLLCAALAVLSFAWARSPLFLFIYPALAMLAFHARAAWVFTAIFFVSILASALTAHGLGPIARLSPDGHLMREDMLQPYLFSLLLVVLPINNAVGEKRRYTSRLLLLKANLEYAATHDALTATMNRQMFETVLGTLIARHDSGIVLFIDIDDFKSINDGLGHQAGDEFLKAFGARMRELVGGLHGSVGRFGGDEFAAIVPGAFSPAERDHLCASISDALRAPYRFAGVTRSVTASIGAAMIDPGSTGADDLMRKADIALYMTKASGRNGYTLFGMPPAANAVPPPPMIMLQ